VDVARLIDKLADAELAAQAVQLAETPHGLDDFRVGLRDSLSAIENRSLRGRVRELEEALKEAEEAGDQAVVRDLTLRRMELQQTPPA
jgi:hypothetical protein